MTVPSPPNRSPLDQAVVDAFDALPPRKQAFSDTDLAPLRAALAAGGSPDQTEANGYNLLGVAVYRACQQKRKSTSNWPVPKLVALLLEFHADPNRAIHTGTSSAAVREAALSPSLYLLDALLAAGARPEGRAQPVPPSSHRQDLHRAALHNVFGVEQAQRLIAAGADLNVRDENGKTPLHVAVQFKKLDVMDVLIAAGADLNARDVTNSTPLHEVADPDVVQRLLKAGANPSWRNNAGHTPLDSRRKDLDAALQKSLTVPNALRPGHEATIAQLTTVMVLLDRAELQQGLDHDTPGLAHGGARPRL